MGGTVSKAAAEAFLDRTENDDEFREELEALKDDPEAVYEHVRAAGFDVEPNEVMEAFTERYGVELTPEQLEAVAAGDEAELIMGASIGAGLGIGLAAAVCAVF
jgi:predicted ribosomally synthesized peptide with nif11-like leader